MEQLSLQEDRVFPSFVFVIIVCCSVQCIQCSNDQMTKTMTVLSFRPPSSYHDLPGSGHQEDGQEERHRPQPAFCRDPGLHVCHLL